MPAHNGYNGANRQPMIAWLRFVEKEDGIRAALLLASPDGEPLAFCFTRASRRPPNPLNPIAKSLFGSAPHTPALALCLEDEVARDALAPVALVAPVASDPDLQLPICRLAPPPSDGYFPNLRWTTEPPAGASEARRILDTAMKRPDPLEPFDRAAKCLAEAFEDDRVSAAAGIEGLSVVVSLPQPPERAPTRLTDADPSAAPLAERLWAILAVPKSAPDAPPDIRLQWAADLMPFQQEGVSAMLDMKRLLLADDTSATLKRMPRIRSWALTGTPIENDEEELASIMEFVDYDADARSRRYHPGPALLKRHQQLQIRRRKADVLDELPPKQEIKLSIELRPSQRASYDRAERDGVVYLRSLGAEVRVQHILQLITRLKQICNMDPETGESSKLDDIRDRLERLAAQGHKALVFSQYTNDAFGVAAVASRLREFSPITLTGDTPISERAAVIDSFKTDDRHKAMVMSLRAGGLGLNLQEASYVFHMDRWWNPAIERQAEDRSHRMGQMVKVNVIKYSCANTIEERIDEILERKQELFDSIIDDVSLDLSARLSREELLGLFGLA